MEHERREHGDQDTSRRLEDLIARTADPVQQASLLIQSRFNHALGELTRSMTANTEATEKIAEEFTKHHKEFVEHDKQELKRMSWLGGAWWAIAAMFVVVVALTGYIVKEHLESSKELRAETAALQIRLKVVELACKLP